jgi:hypothetical protein
LLSFLAIGHPNFRREHTAIRQDRLWS